MNKPRKGVILIGLIVVALMTLLPPWRHALGHNTFGYWPVFYAPSPSAVVDFARLAAQVLLVAAVCAALWLYRKPDT